MYSPSSPYYKTPFVSGQYLDILKNNHTFGLNAAYRIYKK